ncbi:MAG: MATE family efflux transporter [Clostridia bacterium]|nr:MATE family efflux transporter [Clostridia bacterium]
MADRKPLTEAEHSARAEAQYQRMTARPIPRTVAGLAFPTIISMLVTSMYNMVDTYFVGKIGTSATGAVGIVFPMMIILQAVGMTIGMGAGSTISRLLGRKDPERAARFLSTAFFQALIVGGVLTAVGLLFPNPILRLLGATESILPYARDYARYIFIGAPLFAGSFVLNNALRAEGNAVLSLVGISIGAVINIALDPLFIFTLGLGTGGAAIATVLSQAIGFCILGSHYVTGRAVLRLKPAFATFRQGIVREILRIGSPSLGRQAMASVGMVVLNTAAGGYSDAAIAAMTITNRVSMLVYSTIIGFGQGFQPVVGYNFGAGRLDRVKKAYWFSVGSGTAYMALAAVAIALAAPAIVAGFRADDPEVIRLGTAALRFNASVWVLQAIVIITNMLYQATGHAGPALVMSMARQGIFFIPAVLILEAVAGLNGLLMAQAVADLFAFALALVFMVRYLRRGLALRRDHAVGQDAPSLQRAESLAEAPVEE